MYKFIVKFTFGMQEHGPMKNWIFCFRPLMDKMSEFSSIKFTAKNNAHQFFDMSTFCQVINFQRAIAILIEF